MHRWPTGGESAASLQHDGGRVVEIGANRQSCDPSTTLLFKLVLEVVLGVASCLHGKDNMCREHSIPLKSAD